MKVGEVSSIRVRASAVRASTSMTRYSWCPRALYSKVSARLSFHQTISLRLKALGSSVIATGCAARVAMSNSTGCITGKASPGLG